MNDAAIIIDCWETWYSKNKIAYSDDYKMFLNIKKFISSSPNIKTIILASYNVIDSPIKIWHQNSLKLLGPEKFNSKDLISHLPPDEYRTTDTELLNWVLDRYQISMHYTWELELLLTQTKIDNFYLCGGSTDQCVMNRPLGWESLADIIKSNNMQSRVLLHKECVNDDNGNTFVLEKYPGWVATSDPFIFEYIKV